VGEGTEGGTASGVVWKYRLFQGKGDFPEGKSNELYLHSLPLQNKTNTNPLFSPPH
jgi:oligosaccharyltransferase complex subunit gamma